MESRTVSFGYAEKFLTAQGKTKERDFGFSIFRTDNPTKTIRVIHDLCRSMDKIVSVPTYFVPGNKSNKDPWYFSMTWVSPDNKSYVKIIISEGKIRYSDVEFEYHFDSGCICGSFYQKDGSVCPTVSDTLLGYECAKTLKDIVNGQRNEKQV